MKPLQETLKKSVTQTLNTTEAQGLDKKNANLLQKTVAESFEKSFVPQITQSVSIMFQQISKAFDEGLNKRFDDLQSKEMARISQLSQSLQKSVSDAVSDIPKGVNHHHHSSEEKTSKKSSNNTSGGNVPVVAEVVQPKPPNTIELFANVQKLMNSKNYEEAFSVTLTARNLELLSKVCSSTAPQTVLRSGSLSMATILCLIQQLGFDLTSEVALKLSWLNEALVQVDSKEKTAAQHGPKILVKLKQNLEKVNAQGLPQPTVYELKLTLHLINSLLNAKS
jgi:hypothetical protein